MKRSAQRIVAAPKAATAGEAEEAGARLARNCGKPGFCASKNAPDVVQGKKSDEAISVETTFSELCSNPDKSLGAEPVESSTLEKLTEAKRNLPEQKTQELQKKVNAAVDNIIRNFSAVRMSTGMTPEEAVKLAAKTVGGQRFRRLRAAGKRNRLPDTCYELPVQCPERRRQKDFQRHKNSGLD